MKLFSPAVLVCSLLAAVTLAVYWPVGQHEFINYDDPDYVTENSHVLAGLNLETCRWPFNIGYASNWHPLTWLSHMLDCEIYGLNPRGHHLTNVVLHVLNTILLFGLLKRTTGELWPSAWVAALFAWHPLHVESVAWVAERKDLLSTLFFMFTLGAYASYTAKAQARNPRSGLYYGLALLFFAMGLMSKPMLVTLPFVLLLLDYWPLGRFEPKAQQATRRRNGWLFLEKIPFFALSLLSIAITLVAQGRGGAVVSLQVIPFDVRCWNAFVSWLRYAGKLLWPKDMAVFYPYVHEWPFWFVFLAVIFLLVVSWLAVWLRQTAPYVPVGWFWFLGVLVPVIGLVQVGNQALADRYTYIPSIGFFMVIGWSVRQWLVRWPGWRPVVGLAAVSSFVACASVTRLQVQYWRDSITLFEHALAVTPDNATARNNLGTALAFKGRFEEAAVHFNAVRRLNPNSAVAHCNLGTVLDKQGRPDEALEHYRIALTLDPRNAAAHFNIANTHAAAGRFGDAVSHYQEAIRLQPDYPSAHNNLAIAFSRLQQPVSALFHAREAVRLNPFHAEAWNNLGSLHAEQADDRSAVDCYERAVRIAPGFSQAHFNLAQGLNRLARTNEAITALMSALRCDPGFREARYELAAACARSGDFAQSSNHLAQIDADSTNRFAVWHSLGISFAKAGRFPAAADCFRRALQIRPGDAIALTHLANSLARLDELEAASDCCREALRNEPHNARVHHALGRILDRQGRTKQSMEHLVRAAELQPDWPEALNDAAWLLATTPNAALRNGPQAIRLAERAIALTDQPQPHFLGTLAAAYAAAGRFADATATAQRALTLARQQHQYTLAAATQTRLALYQAGQPFIQELRSDNR